MGLKPTRSEVSKEPQELSMSTPFEVPKELINLLSNKEKIKTEIQAFDVSISNQRKTTKKKTAVKRGTKRRVVM